jgi:hypothetical protein
VSGRSRHASLILAASLGWGPGACNHEDEAPIETARAFSAAVQQGDVKAMVPLLEHGVGQYLQAAAEEASDQVGGRRSIAVHEMLQVVAADPGFAIASARVLDNDGAVAHVELVGPQDERHVLELVHQEGTWRVALPLPAGVTREGS